MESLIIDSGLLPEPITSYIHSDRITVSREKRPDMSKIFRRYTDGKLSSEEFIREKSIERELEGR